MKIIFVRHAQSDGDKLTRLGIKQAKNVVTELNYENVTRVFCSPQNRTADTANIIAKKLHVSVTTDDRLRERDLDTSHLSEQEAKEWSDNYLNPHYSHISPEGCKEFCNRIFSFLDDVIKNSKCTDDESILVVGHSSLAYVMYAYFYGVPKNKDLVWVRVGNASKLAFQSVGK